MPRQIAIFILFLLPVFSFAQVKVSEVVIPPSKDTVKVRFTATTVTTTEYKVDYVPVSTANKPPIASAGSDVAITLPVNTVTLSAISSTDADGTIASYKWEKISGGAATLNQANTALNASGLTQGVYVFRVTVTDNGGLVDNDEVNVVVNPAPTGTRQNIVFEAGFDGSNPFQTENTLYKQGCCSYSITQSKTIVRSGDGSFRAEVRGSDASTSSGYRAELITGVNKTLTEVWYGYSTYLQDWNAFSGGEHIIQWHPNSEGGSAELSLQTASNKFDVVRSLGGANYRQSGNYTGQTSKPLATIIPNKWYDFVWHIKWSTGSAGLIELWIDGEKYYTYIGKNTATSTPPYFKFGINRWNMGSSNRVLYYDNLRIGNSLATYKDVAP